MSRSPETTSTTATAAPRFICTLAAKVRGSQAWPRRWVPDPDNDSGSVFVGLPGGPYFDETKIPKFLVDATCELARELIEQDRTDDPDDEGLKSIAVEGAVNLEFNAATRRPVATAVVQAMLAKVGDYIGGHSGMAKLQRV